MTVHDLDNVTQKILLIGVAGLLVGTPGRYWLSGFVARRDGETFP